MKEIKSKFNIVLHKDYYIHKGKCPHRGFDLSNEIPNKEGIITCPLHNLKFNAETKKLING